jgi:predicted RNA-binding protein with PIN domain
MPEQIVIDGNNLLYNMHTHAPLPEVGRETLVKILERWVQEHRTVVTLVFDGPVPSGGLAQQMTSTHMTVKFSAPATADDIIVSMIEQAQQPTMLRVVSSDTAIQHAARHRRCQTTDAVAFIAELFPPEQASSIPPSSTRPNEKPEIVSPNETDKWLDVFGIDDDENEPFNGHDAMTQ